MLLIPNVRKFFTERLGDPYIAEHIIEYVRWNILHDPVNDPYFSQSKMEVIMKKRNPRRRGKKKFIVV